MFPFLLAFAIGFALGAASYHLIAARNMTALRDAFTSLSAETLQKTTEQILSLAETKLDGKKQVIHSTLEHMRKDLSKVETLMQDIEKGRAEQFGKIDVRLENAAKVIGELQTTASGLRNALSRTQGRGQWGERMAEDVLRLAGFVEGINYIKQKTLVQEAGRPDFTFLLPQDLKLHMDVKFPFDNYELSVNAKTEEEREKFKHKFLLDVRKRIKELQGRAYINPEEHTVDYVLLFIPNEQVYHFINETDRGIIDEALRAKTILCSPLSLYAVLALVRQAVDNFALESKSRDMLSLFGKFREQWQLFKKAMEETGRKLARVQQEYEQDMMGTRLRQVERPLEKIEHLRVEQGLPLPDIASETLEHITAQHARQIASSEHAKQLR